MPEILANNARIAKNTIFLYARMLFVMLVSIYTTRIVLMGYIMWFADSFLCLDSLIHHYRMESRG